MKRPRREQRPTSLGRYELVREIGRGGMGVIFEGREPAQGRRVAIKVLAKQAAGEAERVRRFQREVQTIAMLSHRGIVRIFDVAEDAGRYYYVMEFVDGRPLRELGEGAAMPLRRGLEAIAQIADALGHAHGQGVIHRDVNPNNILVEPDGRAVLIDFGIAKLQDTSRLTRAGATIGTPRYLSPEQALGEPDIDARTDVYGLGATLYLLATGRPPFAEEGGQTVSLTALERGPTPPRAMNARVPREVDALIRKAMARRREDRYQNCAAMAADIRTYLETGTVAVSVPRALPRPVLVGLTVALVAVVGGGVATMFGLAGGGARPAASPAAPAPAEPVPSPSPAAARDPQRAGGLLAEAQALAAAGRSADAVRAFFEALAEGADRGEVLLGRAEANASLGKWDLAVADLRELRALATHAGRARVLATRLLPGAAAAARRAADVPSLVALLDEWLAVDRDVAARFDWPPLEASAMARSGVDVLALADGAPGSAAAAYLAACFEWHGRHDAARAATYVERLVGLAPTFASGLRLLAGLKRRAGDMGGAVECLRTARHLAPDLVDLDADGWVVERAGGSPTRAAEARARLVAAAGGELAADLAVVRTFLAWDDWLSAAHAYDAVLGRLTRDDPTYAGHERERERLLLGWAERDGAHLPDDLERGYREAGTRILSGGAARDAIAAALAQVEAAVAGAPHRFASASAHRIGARARLALHDRAGARAAVAAGLACDPTHRELGEVAAWFELAEGRAAEAAARLRRALPPEERDEAQCTSGAVFLAAARLALPESAGITPWCRLRDALAGAAGPATRGRLERALEGLARGRAAAPESVPVCALEAACAHALGQADRAQAALAAGAAGLAAGCPPGPDGQGPLRCARALAEVAAVVGGTRATGTPVARAFVEHRAAWDAKAFPAAARRAVWLAVAEAALATGVPGRAAQALAEARELDAKDAGLEALAERIGEALAAVTGPSAHDEWQFGVWRRYADPRGARETIRRARAAATDGSLLPAERRALEALWNELR